MSSTTISAYKTTVTVTVTAGRPSVDIVVSRLALGMLRWSERRAQRASAAARRAEECTWTPDAFHSAHERAIDAGRTIRLF